MKPGIPLAFFFVAATAVACGGASSGGYGACSGVLLGDGYWDSGAGYYGGYYGGGYADGWYDPVDDGQDPPATDGAGDPTSGDGTGNDGTGDPGGGTVDDGSGSSGGDGSGDGSGDSSSAFRKLHPESTLRGLTSGAKPAAAGTPDTPYPTADGCSSCSLTCMLAEATGGHVNAATAFAEGDSAGIACARAQRELEVWAHRQGTTLAACRPGGPSASHTPATPSVGAAAPTATQAGKAVVGLGFLGR